MGHQERGGQAPGPRGSEQRPFPTWGPNLVLHTQGTEGDYRQTTQWPPPPPPTPSLHQGLNPFPPRCEARELCLGTGGGHTGTRSLGHSGAGEGG